MRPVTPIAHLFDQHSHKTYGELCSQLEHAISAATHAADQRLSEELIIAAFLHDIGHFVADEQQLAGFDEWGHRDHDQIGADFLKAMGFPAKITEPIRLHVQAKRYQAATSANPLSTASAATLSQQGGAMSAEECTQFERNPWFQQALLLRDLDDLGKPDHLESSEAQHWFDFINDYMIRSFSGIDQ